MIRGNAIDHLFFGMMKFLCLGKYRFVDLLLMSMVSGGRIAANLHGHDATGKCISISKYWDK